MNDIKAQIRTTTDTMNGSMLVEFTVAYLERASYDAMENLMMNVAKQVAGRIFKENKKKILAGIKIDLLVAEIEKNLLEKIKNHSKTSPNT